MKVVGISGSARKNGNTAILMQTVFEELNREGIETELIQLCDKDIAFCIGCFGCRGKKQCVYRKDGFNDCFEKLLAADGVVLGSPVYSADVSAKMKAFLERAGAIAAVNPGILKHKIAAAVAAARRGGAMTAIDAMNHFFLNKEMILVGSTYWNMAYGKDVGDVHKDAEGMENMRNIGRNMAWLAKRLRESPTESSARK